MPWHGQPRITTTSLGTISIQDYFYPDKRGPIAIQLEDCDDFFVPIFSTVEKLEAHIDHLVTIVGDEVRSCKVVQITDEAQFLEYIYSFKVFKMRLMIDPECPDDHHTKWTELYRDDDQWKAVVAEFN